MKEKLYKIWGTYYVVGKRNTGWIFKNPKEYKVEQYMDEFFVITNKKNISKGFLRKIQNRNKIRLQEIEERGVTLLYDWSIPFIPEIYLCEISGVEIKELHYEEATIQECIEHLTPAEYKRIYGNNIIIGKEI